MNALNRSSGHWEVSEDNPFIMEWHNDLPYLAAKVGGNTTRPNWALINPLAVILFAAIVTVCILLYRHWRKNNYCPVYFAGKVKYVRKGETLERACALSPIYGDNWLIVRHRELTAAGFKINGLFSDPALTKHLNKNQIVNGPVHIFPKLQK